MTSLKHSQTSQKLEHQAQEVPNNKNNVNLSEIHEKMYEKLPIMDFKLCIRQSVANSKKYIRESMPIIYFYLSK